MLCAFSDRQISSNVSSQITPKHSSNKNPFWRQPERACLNLARNWSLASDSVNLDFGFRAARISFANKDCISSTEQKAALASQAGRAKSYPRTMHRLFTGPPVNAALALFPGGLMARANCGMEHTPLGVIAPGPRSIPNPRQDSCGFVRVTVTVVPRP